MKTVLITGSNSGFGKLMVHTLAKDGHKVFATMRNTDSKNSHAAQEMMDWAKDNEYDVHILDLDVTDEKSVEDAVKQATQKAGKIDVGINIY